MFVQPENSGQKKRSVAVTASFALHVAVLLIAVWPAKPMFVKPEGVRAGEGGTTLTPLYLARRGFEGTDRIPVQRRSKDAAKQHTTAQLRAPRLKQGEQEQLLAKNDQEGTLRSSSEAQDAKSAGSIYGSLSEGNVTGQEVRPALPIVGPQPAVSPSDLPPGFAGDVIAEITIDQQGNVVRTSLVHGIGFGVDEKVLAVLQNWHFRPATRDGSPIPSQQDVYFHFAANGTAR